MYLYRSTLRPKVYTIWYMDPWGYGRGLGFRTIGSAGAAIRALWLSALLEGFSLGLRVLGGVQKGDSM